MSPTNKNIKMSLDKEINKLEDALKILQDDLKILQKGDKEGPYWNGENAYFWVKGTLANVDHTKTLLKNLYKCQKSLEKSADK